MTKSTITRERIAQIANTDAWVKCTHEEVRELARMALAAMDSEPVDSNYRKLFTCTGCGAEGLDEPLETNCHCCVDGAHWVESRLYRHAQPAPVVPEEMTPQQASRSYGGEVRGYRDGWNACRAAMLQPLHTIKAASALGSLPKTGEVLHTNSPVIPDGYVMVPKDPTAEMQSAGASAIRIETTALNKLWTGNAVFRAMLAAAPQEVK